MKFTILFLFSFFAAQAIATEFFVDASVKQPGDGKTWQTAFRDFADVPLAQSTDATTIWIRGGQYSRLFLRSVKNITVRIDPETKSPAVFAAENESRIFGCQDILIDGLIGQKQMFHFHGRQSAYTTRNQIVPMLEIIGSQRVIIRGLSISREKFWAQEMPFFNGIPESIPKTIGINIANNSGPNDDITIDECDIRYMTSDGVRIPKTEKFPATWDNYIVRKTSITNVGSDGISFGAHGVTVDGCRIDRNNQPVPRGAHMDGVQAIPRAKFIRIKNNFIVGFPMQIFIERSCGPVEVYNNIAAGRTLSDLCRAISASPSEFADAPFSGHWLVANNTFVDTWNYPAYHGAGSVKRVVPQNELYVGNNIFLNCKEIYTDKSNFGPDFDNSSEIYWNTPGIQYYKQQPDKTNAPIATPKDQKSFNARFVDPLLKNPSNDNFELLSSSPAIKTGKNFSAFFAHDHNGEPRAKTGPWDIGALAYSPDLPITPSQDKTPPELCCANISASGTQIILSFSERVDGVEANQFSIPGFILSNAQGIGPNWTLDVERPIPSFAEPTINYVGGANKIVDSHGNVMADTSKKLVNGAVK